MSNSITTNVKLDAINEIDQNQILFYQTQEGKINIDVYFVHETFWLSQKKIAELFGVESHTITYHLKEIYATQELEANSTTRKFRVVQKEGTREVNREVDFYNLDAIIAVGYRVNSKQATQFRKWATQTLKEYIIKGFVLNDEMLKNGRKFGKDYFDDLLEQIREIRSSERRAYQKIADVFEQCSYDYDKSADATKTFYAFIQNKMHFAISGRTAAEIIYNRVDSEKPFMGLTHWKNSPDGKILKSDVKIAKNYLNHKEIANLNRLVTMFIDFAESQAIKHKLISMNDWIKKTNDFLKVNDEQILHDSGKVTHEAAIEKAEEEYGKFRIKQDQDYTSNFDKDLELYLSGSIADDKLDNVPLNDLTTATKKLKK